MESIASSSRRFIHLNTSRFPDLRKRGLEDVVNTAPDPHESIDVAGVPNPLTPDADPSRSPVVPSAPSLGLLPDPPP